MKGYWLVRVSLPLHHFPYVERIFELFEARIRLVTCHALDRRLWCKHRPVSPGGAFISASRMTCSFLLLSACSVHVSLALSCSKRQNVKCIEVSCIVRTPACLCYALVTMLGWCSSILLGKSSSNDWRKSALAKRTCCNDIGFQDVYCAVWCFHVGYLSEMLQERHTQSVAGCMVQTRHAKLSGYSLPDSGWWLCEANHRVIEHPWTSSLPFQPVEICRALDSWQRTHRWPQFPIFAELSQGSHTWSILKISGWWKIKEYERNVDLQD